MSSDFDDDHNARDGGGGNDRDRFAEQKDAGADADRNGAYEVGYKRPPKHSRVVERQVLNPKGRPKGAKNKPKEASEGDVRAIVLKEANRQVQVNDANGPLTVTMLEAVIRAQAVAAAKGSVRAQRDYIAVALAADRGKKADRGIVLAAAIEYKLRWATELKRREFYGIQQPDPVPHPDDLVIVEATGTVHIRGPATAEEIARWQELHKTTIAELTELEAQRDDPDRRNKGEVLAEIEQTKQFLNIIERALDGSRKAMLALQEIPEDCS